MQTSASFSRRSLLLVLYVVLVGSVVRVHAQDVTEVTLKGAFLFNFARFTEWPSESLPEKGTVFACVVGDRGVGDALAKAVMGRRLDGRMIVVSNLEPTASLPQCHLLYVSGVARTRVTEIVSGLRETPVLTVSDSEEFAKTGGIVQIFVENGKMKFRINPRTAKRARLQLSSRLLALADLVDEDVRQPSLAGPATRSLTPSTTH